MSVSLFLEKSHVFVSESCRVIRVRVLYPYLCFLGGVCCWVTGRGSRERWWKEKEGMGEDHIRVGNWVHPKTL